jgi:hypothetical protein
LNEGLLDRLLGLFILRSGICVPVGFEQLCNRLQDRHIEIAFSHPEELKRQIATADKRP